MQDGNNIIVFIQSEGYIRLEKGTHATSKQLYSAYSQWYAKANIQNTLLFRIAVMKPEKRTVIYF